MIAQCGFFFYRQAAPGPASPVGGFWAKNVSRRSSQIQRVGWGGSGKGVFALRPALSVIRFEKASQHRLGGGIALSGFGPSCLFSPQRGPTTTAALHHYL